MTKLSDNVLDKGLSYLTTKAAKMHLCSAEPANYAGIAALSVANADVAIGAPKDAAPNGREVVVPEMTNAYTVTKEATNASHYVITDGAGELLAAKTMDAAQVLYVANEISTPEFSIRLPDPA